jgi:hypothetical protein
VCWSAVSRAFRPRAHRNKPFLLLPFVGVQSIHNDNSGTGPGLRVGGLVGARLNEQFSFNGELLFDLENLSNVPPGVNENVYFIQFAVAPLFHLQASPMAEIVIGPKLGLFFDHASLSGYGLDASGSSEGLLLGANLGAFFRVSDALSLGGLFNFDYMREEWCSNDQGSCTVSDDVSRSSPLRGPRSSSSVENAKRLA